MCQFKRFSDWFSYMSHLNLCTESLSVYRNLFVNVYYLFKSSMNFNQNWNVPPSGVYRVIEIITFLNILISFQKYLFGDTKKPWYIY